SKATPLSRRLACPLRPKMPIVDHGAHDLDERHKRDLNFFGASIAHKGSLRAALGSATKIARAYGLHVGLDVARGPDDTARLSPDWQRLGQTLTSLTKT